MTTAAFRTLAKPTMQALAEVKRMHCAPPSYKPAEQVTGHMQCPRCRSRINFTVLTTGATSGRCVALGCISWSNQ